ncbi:MAG: winged helix DNA-binding domain-containing protein [Gemmatimonadaceae bacterium]
MKLSDVARQRLATQHLLGTGLATPSDVVARLGAIQAQDYPGAKWAVAQRTSGATEATVEAAMTNGSILRTHVLRPTWHFVAPADIRWMLALTASRIKRVMGYYNVQLGLDDSVFRRSARALERALSGGRALTRGELVKILQRARVNVVGEQRLGRVLMDAELDGLICSGPRRGKQFTYSLLDERAPATSPLERDESLLKLTRIYFTTRGPATPADFAWWSGLTVGDANRGIDLAGRDLVQTTIDGRVFWVAAEAGSGKLVSSSHLLSNYDEFFIAYRDRSPLAQRLKKSAVQTRTDTLFTSIAIVDGQLVGTWRRTLRPKGVTVKVNPLIRITGAEIKKLRAAAKRYSSYLELPGEFVEGSALYQSS